LTAFGSKKVYNASNERCPHTDVFIIYQHSSVLATDNIVPEMTYIVSRGTLSLYLLTHWQHSETQIKHHHIWYDHHPRLSLHSLLTNTLCLPSAPLKLRPYVAIQIYILLLWLLLSVHPFSHFLASSSTYLGLYLMKLIKYDTNNRPDFLLVSNTSRVKS